MGVYIRTCGESRNNETINSIFVERIRKHNMVESIAENFSEKTYMYIMFAFLFPPRIK